MIQILIWLLILLLGWMTPARVEQPPVTVEAEQAPSPSRIPMVIESVDALLLESHPAQIRLNVSGYQPDGCDYPIQVEQTRDGSQIRVEIFREVPADVMCPMMIVGYQDTIALEGSFESGTYTIDVNGTVIEVTV